MDSVSGTGNPSAERFLSYARVLPKLAKFVRPTANASEIGESFRFIAPKLVTPLHLFSFIYVGLDALSVVSEAKSGDKLMVGIDRLIWHSMASISFPTFVINRIVHLSHYSISKLSDNPKLIRIVPPLVGLVAIPFVIEPIDELADWIMDRSFRSMYRLDKEMNDGK